MSRSPSESEKCCSMEKMRLKESIFQCDYCSTSWREHRRCLRRAARDSGVRARVCIMN